MDKLGRNKYLKALGLVESLVINSTKDNEFEVLLLATFITADLGELRKLTDAFPDLAVTARELAADFIINNLKKTNATTEQ